MGQQRSAGVLREHKPYIQTRFLPTFLVHLPAIIRSTATSHMFLFKFLRISGEGRLVSDLSVQRRHVTEQRVALRLANPVLPLSTLATTTTTTNCVEAERPGTSKTVIRAEIANVPLSPALGVANISDAVKSLPKCLMHSDGNVFD
ncbi:hypothetical protein WA026_019771 [Henosepilachna vigintioctopunctata]|uniref:Uncharacterized protein n=1 Tax=Henosepilachna vigintioctopunctata TaxID=420089 RepID=A0AAW1UME8_9CUCU